MMYKKYISIGLSIGLSCSVQTALAVTADQYQAFLRSEPLITQIVVKTANAPTINGRVQALTQSSLNQLMAEGGLPLSYKRSLSNGSHVLKLPYAMTEAQALAYTQDLAKNANLAFAEPDRWMHPMVESLVPNDTQFSEQWHLQSPEQYVGAANVAQAWSISQGSAAITIADIDTGITAHPDLVNRLVGGQASKAGYDFINDLPTANDKNARDTDPSDPGDWLTQADSQTPEFTDCEVGDSSWHGTHTAGIMAAQANNATGIAGVDWHAKLLVARVLGKCGGYTSDIADAMRWAAGMSVTNVPTNSTPAKVLNLSLGGTTETATCSNTYQSAINDVVNRGAVVVVAAGNETMDAKYSEPANCQNVITVAAVDQNANGSWFSNFGAKVDIAAPGESIISTNNAGVTAPTTDILAIGDGTSFATPIVSGTVALMLATNENLKNNTLPTGVTVSSAIENNLKASSRAFPTAQDKTQTYGVGLVDAYQALLAVQAKPTANAGADQTVAGNTTVTLDASASTNGAYGTPNLAKYVWTQIAGDAVTLNNSLAAKASFTIPNVANKSYSFKVTVTNDVGFSSSDEVMVTANSVSPVPTPSSGGGGSWSWFGLGLASLLAFYRFKTKQ